MMEQRSNGHSVSRLSVDIVWHTKYRYDVLLDYQFEQLAETVSVEKKFEQVSQNKLLKKQAARPTLNTAPSSE